MNAAFVFLIIMVGASCVHLFIGVFCVFAFNKEQASTPLLIRIPLSILILLLWPVLFLK